MFTCSFVGRGWLGAGDCGVKRCSQFLLPKSNGLLRLSDMRTDRSTISLISSRSPFLTVPSPHPQAGSGMSPELLLLCTSFCHCTGHCIEAASDLSDSSTTQKFPEGFRRVEMPSDSLWDSQSLAQGGAHSRWSVEFWPLVSQILIMSVLGGT